MTTQYIKDKNRFFEWFVGVGVVCMLTLQTWTLHQTFQNTVDIIGQRTLINDNSKDIQYLKEKNTDKEKGSDDRDKKIAELYKAVFEKPKETELNGN